MGVQVAHALRPYPGFDTSGDATVLRRGQGGTLFGVLDVLGHGPDAAAVANVAVARLQLVDLTLPIEGIVEDLHQALTRTRGAAAGLCMARGNVIELAIVGNIGISSLGTRVGVVRSPGIVGRRLKRLRAFRFSMRAGDRIALFSDGLHAVDLVRTRRLETAPACETLLRDHAVSSDDASVVVADFDQEP